MSPLLPLPSTSSFPPTTFCLPALHHWVSPQQQFLTSTSTEVHLSLHQHDEHQSIKVCNQSVESRILHFLFLFTSTRCQGHRDETPLFHPFIRAPSTHLGHYILYLPTQVPHYCISRVFYGNSEPALQFMISPLLQELQLVLLDLGVFGFSYVISGGQIPFTFGKSRK